MNNEHKPEPWRSPWRIHRLEKGFEIFWRDDGDGVESYTYVATARQYDNARLIAAAPEMLAVLKAVRNSIDDSLMLVGCCVGCQSFSDSHDILESAQDAIDAIEATINDATKEEA